MNYFDLANTTPQVLEKIAQAEKQGDFSEHLDPIDYENCYPVDGSFEYIPTGKTKFRQNRDMLFIVNPFSFIVNRFLLKTKIYGKENLKGIKNAIVTSNHVNKLDALAVRKAVKSKHFKVMVGDFNNQKGRLGDFIRAYGAMPFSQSREAYKNFDKAVSYYLKNNTYILFFPERSEWWCYEKPRPYMDGAYHFAVKNNVPVIPVFITFTKTGKYFSNKIEKRQFHVHILKPIYPDEKLTAKQNVEYMKNENFKLCTQCYESFYNKQLEY